VRHGAAPDGKEREDMTAEPGKTESQLSSGAPAEVAAPAGTRLISRRMVLRGASAAVPTILSLQSGAALAASSNYLATIQDANAARDGQGYVKCIDTASAVQETSTPKRLDLGPSPDLHMQHITPRQYFYPKTTGSGGDKDRPATMEAVCNQGGEFWYKNSAGDWQQLVSTAPAGQQKVAAGFLVSSTASASVSSWVSQTTYF